MFEFITYLPLIVSYNISLHKHSVIAFSGSLEFVGLSGSTVGILSRSDVHQSNHKSKVVACSLAVKNTYFTLEKIQFKSDPFAAE